MKRNQGVSLIEILISCVIIALLVSGLGSVFVAGSRWIMNIHAQTAAKEIGRLFIDSMQRHVRQSDWDTVGINALALDAGALRTTFCDNDAGHIQNPLCQVGGPIAPLLNRRHVGKIDYNARYDVQAFHGVRKVRVTINWQEPDIH